MFFFEIPVVEGKMSSAMGSAAHDNGLGACPDTADQADAPVAGPGSRPKRTSILVVPNSDYRDPEQYRHASLPADGSGGLPQRKLHVLVVDDSALNRKMLLKRFEKEGYSLAEADDGDTAVAFVQDRLNQQEPLDVITMDNVLYFLFDGYRNCVD